MYTSSGAWWQSADLACEDLGLIYNTVREWGWGIVTPWRYTSVMSDLMRLRQEDHKFESVSMTYKDHVSKKEFKFLEASD